MTIPVTICDDSLVARKQIARSLPENWDVEVTFATNGIEGLEAVRQSKAEVLFLDLTMPGMDGFEVLEVVSREQLNTVVIVVSGDIQPVARERVMKLGAIEFVKKPTSPEYIQKILNQFGLITETIEGSNQIAKVVENTQVSLTNVYQEISNIAMGQATDLLARYFDVFFVLPIPSVNMIEATDIQMMLQSINDSRHSAAVFQGFIGNNIAGESMMIFNHSNFDDIARLLKHEGDITADVEIELMTDMTSILVGAFLKSYFGILDVQFSQAHPKMFAETHINNLGHPKRFGWDKTLSIEINYTIEGYDLNCDLLILFADDTINEMDSRVEFYAA